MQKMMYSEIGTKNKCKINSSSVKGALEYLGYWVTRDHIKPLPQKVQAILDSDTPKTKNEVRYFIGMVNYY